MATRASWSTNGYMANFASAGVGTGIGVTVSGLTLSGASAGNYTLTQPTGLMANITAIVTITSGISANNKPYDGTAATISSNNVVLNGCAGGDAANVSCHERLCGELCERECGDRHRGDGEWVDADWRQRDQLHADAAGGIDGEHHGGWSDDHFGHHGQQQAV